MKNRLLRVAVILAVLVGLTLTAGTGCDSADGGPTASQPRSHLRLTIESAKGVTLGGVRDISVTIEDTHVPRLELGGFDILIGYHAATLLAIGVEPGGLIDDCGWEYFQYRHGPFGDCDVDCVYRELRVMAISDLNDPDGGQPSCLTVESAVSLFNISFYITNDHTFRCTEAPIRFLWNSCADNVLFSKLGDTARIATTVFDYNREREITNFDNIDGYPTYTGGQNSDCFSGQSVVEQVRSIDFYSGVLEYECEEPETDSPLRLSIETTHNTLQGMHEMVDVTLEHDSGTPILFNGFDILIAYEPSAISFQQALEGDLYSECAWGVFHLSLRSIWQLWEWLSLGAGASCRDG